MYETAGLYSKLFLVKMKNFLLIRYIFFKLAKQQGILLLVSKFHIKHRFVDLFLSFSEAVR